MKSGIIFKLLRVASMAVAFGIGLGVPPAAAQAPIKLGASLSMTGTYAAPGQNQQRGYQLCGKHVNEKGGVLGRKIEFVLYDDRSEPATAGRLYERLITQDKVDAIQPVLLLPSPRPWPT